jgi:hypothetical protein
MRRLIPSMGIKNPFSPEYNGGIARTDKNLGFVLKMEQDRRVIGIARPMHSGGTSGLGRSLFSRNNSSVSLHERKPGSRWHEVACLHDFVQAVADSTRRCRPLIADSWLIADIKLHLTPLSTSFRSARFELAPRTRWIESRSVNQMTICMISCMKKVFVKRVGRGCTLHPSLSEMWG